MLMALTIVAAAVTSGSAAAQPPPPSPVPSPPRVPVITGTNLVKVLIEPDGTVKTWGNPAAVDPSPPLGTGLKPSQQPEVTTPQTLPGLRDIVGAAVGAEHVLLLTRDGHVLAFGYNDNCEMGTGIDKASMLPVPVPALNDVTQVAAAGWVSTAVRKDGTVWAWGQLGRGPCTALPTKVEGVTGVKKVALDGDSTLALKTDGTVWGWGKNSRGELCDGTAEPRPSPVQAIGITGATDIALDEHAVILLADSTVRMCGTNTDGALGDPVAGAKRYTPFKVPGLTGVVAIQTGGGATIVRLADGTLRAWGLGWYGALGDGHGDQFSARPTAPIGLGPVVAHYMTGNTSYAIRADGTVMGWGALLAPPGSRTEFLLTPSPVFSVTLNR